MFCLFLSCQEGVGFVPIISGRPDKNGIRREGGGRRMMGGQETYEAGVLKALDYLCREGGSDLAVILAVGGFCVQRYLRHAEVTSAVGWYGVLLLLL